MAEPVTGKDAIIQFLKGDDYFAYACATDIAIDFKLETKSVKTIGDGTWKKKRGQVKDYSISLSGLIKFDDDTVPHAFDLLDYLIDMVALQYRIIFTNDLGALKLIEGTALPVNVNLGGGSEGFANGNAQLEGDGAVSIRDLIIPCPSTITSTQLVQDGEHALIRITGHTGSPVRYDYSIDGGAPVTEFVDSFIEDLPLPDGMAIGEHSITITPVCENGYDGTPYTTTFEIAPYGEGGGGSEDCDVPGSLEISGITENSASADWVGSIPGDGYYWELYMGATFISSGTQTLQTKNLTGLTSGTTYTFKVKSLCESGVSESAFVTADFTTTGSDPLTFNWEFFKDSSFGTFGSLKITKNGLLILNTNSNGAGSLTIEAGATVVVYVQELGDGVKSLFVQDTTTPLVLYNEADTSDREFEFVVEALKSYEVIASITE